MQPHPALRRHAAAALCLVLAACGGSSVDGGGGGGGGSPAMSSLSGTAATGAPMAGATIVVRDASGAEVQVCRDGAGAQVACTSGADGRFSISLRSDTRAPLVLTATPPDGGAVQVSMAAQVQDGGTVNITPITTLIAASLSPSGDPHALRPGDFDQTGLQAAVATLLAALQPLLDAVGTTAHPLTGSFAADGTGMDKALDVLDVQIGTDVNGVVTVVAEIRLNGEGTQPASLTMVGGGAPTTSNMGGVNASALPQDGVAPRLAQLLERMGACYNLPHAQRVNTATSPHTLLATACRDLFIDGDPAGYRHNGHGAGPSAAFSGMFGNRDTSGPSGATNRLTFDQPVYEFTRGGAEAGDVVFTFRWRDQNGNQDWEQVVVREQNGAFRLVGNRYLYDARVRPHVQRREAVESASTGFSYFSSGYNTWVRNHVDGSGNPLFDRVQITTPAGRLLTVWPSPGFDRMNYRLANGSVSGTSVINLQWAYWGGGSVGPSGVDLANIETGRVFARDAMGNPQPWTDAQIQAIPNQGRWRFDFFLAGNTGATPDATQWHTTLTRAQTLGEVRALTWSAFVPAVRDSMRADIDPALGGILFDAPDFLELRPELPGDPQHYWQVPAGALAPTWIDITGNFTDGAINQRFNDGQGVRSTATTAQLRCSRASVADQHCEVDGAGNSTGRFRAGNVVQTIELWGKTSRGVERSAMYALYRRLP